ncbi:MAG: Flp pilus assembly protein CpaB [Anaerolineales bacterium]|nr:Flp pilus assembly protein CpaB [Anaerolineales bacterium]
MRRGRILIVVALILILCVVAAYFVTRGLGQGTGTADETQQAPDVAFIVIAAQDIPRGAEIVPDAVVSAPFPADSVVETMLTDPAQAVGFRARMDIARGLPITENMLTKTPGDVLGSGSEASIAIPRGQTAIAVPISRLSSVAYALRAGDNVDVLATFLIIDLDQDFQTRLPNETLIMLGTQGENLTAFVCNDLKQGERGPECLNPVPPPFGKLVTEETSEQPLYAKPSEEQRPRIVTQRLIDYATVLHLGTFALEQEEELSSLPVATDQSTAPPAQGQAAAPVTTIIRPDIVTLIVSPQDALALNWAIKAGVDLVLTLRAPGDTSADETTSVTLQYLLDNYDITVPIRLPIGLEPRLDQIIEPVLPNDTPAPASTGP